MSYRRKFPILSTEDVSTVVRHGDTVAFSGFTAAGAAKAVPRIIVEKAKQEHKAGREFRIRVLSGASTNPSIDHDLAKAGAISWRAPYQNSKFLRDRINRQETEYVDMHLSHLPQTVKEGFFGEIDLAVVEATEVTSDGRVYLTTSIGASPTFLQCARRVIIEINRAQSPRLSEMADIIIMPPPPRRYPIRIYDTMTRVGWPYCTLDPDRVVGIVDTHEEDGVAVLNPPDQISRRIAGHVIDFFLKEMAIGRIPKCFLPLQAGVGNMANAVLAGLGGHPDIPKFSMYSEVFQDAMADLMADEKLLSASATSLTVSGSRLNMIVDNMDFFGRRIVLRPQEISNHPGIIRRLGVISMNTAIEVDVYGNVNSSHICGTKVVNGIGGSGEFTRNSFLSIYMTPSIAKEGKISAIVPMCSHVDNNEHSVQVVVTEQGLVDLRGLGPIQRARAIIDNCAHPKYKPYLSDYLANAGSGHIPVDLVRCFELHRNYLKNKEMLPS